MTNTLFYGDNLDIMREYIASESVDLIYLDPPFNSSRSYNVLFKDESFPKIQILTIEDLLYDKTVDMPRSATTFKRAERVKDDKDKPGQKRLM